jgi:hypothetical protein
VKGKHDGRIEHLSHSIDTAHNDDELKEIYGIYIFDRIPIEQMLIDSFKKTNEGLQFLSE